MLGNQLTIEKVKEGYEVVLFVNGYVDYEWAAKTKAEALGIVDALIWEHVELDEYYYINKQGVVKVIKLNA